MATIILNKGDALRVYRKECIGRGKSRYWQQSWIVFPKGKACIPNAIRLSNDVDGIKVVDNMGRLVQIIKPYGREEVEGYVDYIMSGKWKLEEC